MDREEPADIDFGEDNVFSKILNETMEKRKEIKNSYIKEREEDKARKNVFRNEESVSDLWLTRRPADELTKIFRIAFSETIEPDQSPSWTWDSKMNIFLDDKTNHIRTNGKDRSSAKGNFNKAFKSGYMSWKTFRQAIKFLGAASFRIEIHINWGKSKPIDKRVGVWGVSIPITEEHPTSQIK